MTPVLPQPSRPIVFALMLLATATPSPARAGAAGPDSLAAAPAHGLHLDEALALALAANWDLLAARSDAGKARAAERTAREWPNPSLSLATSHVHVDGRSDATPLGDSFWTRAYDSVGQLSETIEIGGKRGARRRSARAATRVALAREADMRRTVVDETVRAYASAALAEASARIAAESAGYLRDEARIAAVRWQAGDIARTDRDQIEIEAARLELDAHSAQATARAQRLALETLLGTPRPTGDVALADSLESLAERARAQAPAASRGERADLAAARAGLARASADLDLQRAQRIPDPTLSVAGEHAPPDRPNSVGAGVALTLPFFSRNAGAIAVAESAREDAAREVSRVAAQVAADVAAAQAAYDEAAGRWRQYRDELRPRSDAIRRSVSLAYEKGGASLLDLLQAQRSDNDVRLEAMRAASDLAVAAADLAAATSDFNPGGTRP